MKNQTKLLFVNYYAILWCVMSIIVIFITMPGLIYDFQPKIPAWIVAVGYLALVLGIMFASFVWLNRIRDRFIVELEKVGYI